MENCRYLKIGLLVIISHDNRLNWLKTIHVVIWAVHKLCRLKNGDFWPPPSPFVVFLPSKFRHFWPPWRRHRLWMTPNWYDMHLQIFLIVFPEWLLCISYHLRIFQQLPHQTLDYLNGNKHFLTLKGLWQINARFGIKVWNLGPILVNKVLQKWQ